MPIEEMACNLFLNLGMLPVCVGSERAATIRLNAPFVSVELRSGRANAIRWGPYFTREFAFLWLSRLCLRS